MPDQGTIIAMRQRVDFYLWKGIPVGRRWPKYGKHTKSAAEQAGVNRFTWAAKGTSAIGTEMITAYKEMIDGVGVTWVDMQRAQWAYNSWIEVSA